MYQFTLGLFVVNLTLLSALHASGRICYDIATAADASLLSGFIVGLYFNVPKSKLAVLTCISFLALLLAAPFSWAELIGELDPNLSDRGWGMLWFLVNYQSSFAAVCAALAIKWFIATCRFQTKLYYGDRIEDSV
jgi:hypothetical protein